MSATTNSAKVAGAGSSGGGAGGGAAGAGKLPLPKSAIVLDASAQLARGADEIAVLLPQNSVAALTLAMWTRHREGYELVSGGQRQHRAPPTTSCRLFFVLGLVVGILLGLSA